MRLSTSSSQRYQGWSGTSNVQRTLFAMEMGWGDMSEMFRAAADIIENDPKEALEYSERITGNIES